MKRTLLIGLALVLLTSGAVNGRILNLPADTVVSVVADDPVSDEDAIMEVLEKQLRAFAERNLDGEAAVWANTPNVVRMTEGSPMIVGWEDVSASYQTWFEDNSEPTEDLSFTHYDVNLNVIGDAAWVVYKQHFEGRSDAQPFDITSREVRFLTRIDGEWRIVYQYTAPIDTVEEDI